MCFLLRVLWRRVNLKRGFILFNIFCKGCWVLMLDLINLIVRKVVNGMKCGADGNIILVVLNFFVFLVFFYCLCLRCLWMMVVCG